MNTEFEKVRVGWVLNENNELELDYYSGNAFPEETVIVRSDEEMEEADDEDDYLLSDDSDTENSDNEEEFSDDEWTPK